MKKMLKISEVMKWKVFLLVFLSTIFLSACKRNENQENTAQSPSAAPVSAWKEFSSAEGKFSCQFPGDPQEQQASTQVPQGEVKTIGFTVQTDIKTVYAVGYSEYPSTIKLLAGSEAFDKTEAAVVDKASGKVIFQQDLMFGNYPAREYEYVAGGAANYSGRVKIIIIGQRVYQIATIFLTANPHPKDREFFFNSLQIQN
jgi:hypothetical protein